MEPSTFPILNLLGGPNIRFRILFSYIIQKCAFLICAYDNIVDPDNHLEEVLRLSIVHLVDSNRTYTSMTNLDICIEEKNKGESGRDNRTSFKRVHVETYIEVDM